jgi:hypothetical protein
MQSRAVIFRAALPLVGLVCALSGAAACASTRAQTRTDPAPLEIPEPPPRLIETLPEVAEIPAPEPERRESVPPLPRPTKPNNRGDVAQTNRSEPKPDATKPPEPIPTIEAPPPAPPRAELRTPDTVDDQAVNQILESAKRMLDRVDYQKLGKEGQEQYDTALRFRQQAQEALAARNQIAAKYLADKAEKIAKELTGR